MDERHKPIPTWHDSYWIGSTRSSLASGIKDNRSIIFHTTRPPERLKPTIRNKWARILTNEGLHRLGNVIGQDGVVKIDIIWEKIKQCFGRNEEKRARRTIIKTITKEFKRLTEVNLFSMTT